MDPKVGEMYHGDCLPSDATNIEDTDRSAGRSLVKYMLGWKGEGGGCAQYA